MSNSLTKSQRLRHFKPQTKCIEYPEEHAGTGLHAAILHTGDIGLVGAYALGKFLLGNLFTLTCIADNLAYTISIGLFAKCLTFRGTYLTEAFIHHGINAHNIIYFPHSTLSLIVLPC